MTWKPVLASRWYVATVKTCPAWGKTIKIPENIDGDSFGKERYPVHAPLRLSFNGQTRFTIVTSVEATPSV
jgi:hypothetical protein